MVAGGHTSAKSGCGDVGSATQTRSVAAIDVHPGYDPETFVSWLRSWEVKGNQVINTAVY